MDKHLLVMKWDYKYDKESTWFDEDSGENEVMKVLRSVRLRRRAISSRQRYTWITTRIPCAKTESLLSAMHTTIIWLPETLFRNRFA